MFHKPGRHGISLRFGCIARAWCSQSRRCLFASIRLDAVYQESPSMNPSVNSTRRAFLQSTSAIAASLYVSGLPAAVSSQEKLRIAVIGCGGRGGGNLQSVSSEHIAALCDVNANNLNRASETHTAARKNTDFRRIFDHAKEFDAVVVSTCEHTHAFATLPALQLGKHVYCEKPLTHNIC
jgi:hypothetical protein